jgi:organic hydroperoxide reductase OsmC/OhrA
MAEPKPRVFEYEVLFDGEGRATAQESTIDIPQTWAPEHLVLAALVDCTLTSLRHHAKREGIEVAATGEADGTVTRNPEHGRFAFVAIEVRLDVGLSPPPADLPGLLAKAERDCFIGASLTAKPRYVWNVS